MKRLLLMLVALLGYMAPSFAQTVTTITYANEEGLVTEKGVQSWEWTHDPFTITLDANGYSSTPRYDSTAKDLRLYATNTFTIHSEGATMTQLVFAIPEGNGRTRQGKITPSTGTIEQTAQGATITWTGEASDLTLTVSDDADFGNPTTNAGQFWATSVEITTVAGQIYEEYNYTPLEYIECTGGARENAFTTDYLPNTNTTVKVGFQQTGENSWMGIFCARNTYAGTGMSLYVNGDNAHLGYFVGDARGENDDFLDYENGARYDVVAHTTKLQWSKNGGEWEEKATNKTEMNATTRKLSFFANPEWDQAFKGKIFYFGYEDNDGAYNYVPVMRHDGVWGFYDETNDKFVLPAQGSYSNYTYKVQKGYEVVTIDATEVTLKEGESATVTATGAKKYTWTSSDETIATVKDGVIEGHVDGDCVITCSTPELGGWEYTIKVSVRGDINYVAWDGESDAVLAAVRYSGDAGKWAYTQVFDSGKAYEGSAFNQVVGAPADDANGNAWYAAEHAVAEGSGWSYNNTVIPNGWPTTMSDVYARRYFKAKGDLSGKTVYMATPHDDSPCEYYINGTLVWSRTGFEACNGWYEDEVVRLTDEQKALIKTDGSINVFAYHVHQNWGGLYADGGLYIGGKPKDLYEGDANTRAYFENLLSIAEAAEGIDMNALAEARKHLNWRQDANDTWIIEDLICMEMRKVLSPRYEYAAASAEPADGLECWIYNVGTGQFLGGGNNWGTHTSVKAVPSSWPMILRTNTSGENRYSIQTNLPNGIRGNNDWLGHNGFVDCAGVNFASEDWAWTFEPVGDGSYRIINSQNRGEKIYLGVTEGRLYQVDTDKAGADNPYNHWKLITKAQLEVLYEAATEATPANISYKIHQNSFSQNDFDGNDKGAAGADLNDSKWERNAGSVFNWKGNDVDGDYVFEMWNTSGDVYLKQTVEGLRPGKYIVRCNGYYRDGDWESAVAGNDARLAYLYAGSTNNAVALKSILEDAGKAPLAGRAHDTYVIPDGCKDAAKYFQYGLYENEIVAYVGADGKLELGVFRSGEDVKDRDWIVVDNFRLFYLGESNGLPEKMNIRFNNNWNGVEMAEVETEDILTKHFHYEGWLGTNRDEGIFINFKDGEGNFWCPTQSTYSDQYATLHEIACNVQATDLKNVGKKEGAGYAVTAPTNMISVDVYMHANEGQTVVFKHIAPDMCGDAIYITAEKYGWSREPDEAHTLAKVEDGVYEGVVTITREDAYFDMVRLYTKANNGDNDNYIGFHNHGRKTTYAADGTLKLSYRPEGNFRMRKGDTKVRVDLNEGEATFEFLGEASYVYAVGNVKGQTWANNNKDVKLWENKAGSLTYRGVVEMDEGEVTFFEERTATGWSEGRWGPKEGGKQPAKPAGEWYDGLNRWGDYAWKEIPAGRYLMTLDVPNDRFMYETLPGKLVEFDYEINEKCTMATFTAAPMTKDGTLYYFFDEEEEPAGMVENGTFQVAAAPDQVGVDGVAHIVVYVREYDANMELIAENGAEIDLVMPKPEIVINTAYNEDNSQCVITAEPTQEGTSLIISIDGTEEEFMELPAEGYTVAWLESQADEFGICIYNIIVKEVLFDEDGEMTVVAEGFEQVHVSKPIPEMVVNIVYNEEDHSSALVYAQPAEEGTQIIYTLDANDEEPEWQLYEGPVTLAWMESRADEFGICIYNFAAKEVIFDEEGDMTVVSEFFEQIHLAKPFGPLYAAVGETLTDEDWESEYQTAYLVDTKIQVEAYEDYVILKNFDGEDGYDLKVGFDEEENVTSVVVINGDKETDATKGWAYSGKNNWYAYANAGYSYAGSDPETESGYVLLSAYVGDDHVYYYVAWGEAGVEVAELPFDYEYAEDYKSVTFTVTPTTEGSTILYFFDDDEEAAGMAGDDNTFVVAAAPGQVDPQTHVAHFVVYIREYVIDGEDMILVAENGVEVDLLDPMADGINSIAAELEAGNVYNVAGQRVSKAKNGVFIVNGKKVLVK